jgi:hypothetical protein
MPPELLPPLTGRQTARRGRPRKWDKESPKADITSRKYYGGRLPYPRILPPTRFAQSRILGPPSLSGGLGVRALLFTQLFCHRVAMLDCSLTALLG